ncbi:hypothetical protein QZN11_41185, partial [Streptomyces gramineus]
RARREPDERLALPPALPAATAPQDDEEQPSGRRRRALAAAAERAEQQQAGPRPVFALPPAEADRAPEPAAVAAEEGRHDAVAHDQAEDHTPPQPHPTSAPTGRRRRSVGQPEEGAQAVVASLPAQAGAPG